MTPYQIAIVAYQVREAEHRMSRPLISLRRVGGLYHWRIGRLGGSVYIKRTTAPRGASASRAPYIAAAALALVSCQPAQAPAPTYEAIVTLVSGNEYVIDHDLSASDCATVIADMPTTEARCELTQTH